MSRAKPHPEPLPEVVLDKMLDVLEGPVNRTLERVLSSKVVLAPLSLTMRIGLKLYTKLHGAHPAHVARHAHKNGGAR